MHHDGVFRWGPRQVAGGPAWLDVDRFEIDAKADQPTEDDSLMKDRTGLSGEFDVHLNLTPSDFGHPPINATEDDAKLARDPAEIFARVRAGVQKLGLHIEPSKGPSESLFVERAEKPSAN